MADRLVYKGGATVTELSGSGMQLVHPSRGGSVHKFPRWWNKKGTVQYVECAIFKVSLDNGTEVRLVIPHTDPGVTIEIRHDGAGNFIFPVKSGCERIAVVEADSTSLIVEYQFSKISGGAVLKRTVGSFPTPPAVAFGTAINKTGTAQVGQTLTFTAATFTGGRGTVSTNLIIQTSATGTNGWNFLDGNPGTASGATVTYTIPAGQLDQYIRGSYQVQDDDGTVSSNTAPTSQIIAA